VKLIRTIAVAACLVFAQVHAQASTGSPNLSSIADGKSWKVTDAIPQVVELDGRKVVRLIATGDSANGDVGLARPNGLTFSTGTIEIDLKGQSLRGRSFLGVAFNVVDEKTFEAIYFRPFNFKADEPFGSRSVQYISWPANTWEHLRKNTPGQFERTVTPVPDPDGWFHAQIEVTDTKVRVFVNHAKEPSLVVKRLSAAEAPRAVALFVDSADGLYADFTVTPNRFLAR
jgi:hypothetical protein